MKAPEPQCLTSFGVVRCASGNVRVTLSKLHCRLVHLSNTAGPLGRNGEVI